MHNTYLESGLWKTPNKTVVELKMIVSNELWTKELIRLVHLEFWENDVLWSKQSHMIKLIRFDNYDAWVGTLNWKIESQLMSLEQICVVPNVAQFPLFIFRMVNTILVINCIESKGHSRYVDIFRIKSFWLELWTSKILSIFFAAKNWRNFHLFFICKFFFLSNIHYWKNRCHNIFRMFGDILWIKRYTDGFPSQCDTLIKIN